MMLKVKDLRDSYIEYFKSKGHKHIHSSSLIPKDDPTLLFTTAGMVQFKPHFAGTIDVDYNSATTIQKCLRTSDLENVGRTKRHCTFFEMLGNFAFGSYFKREAIQYAWEYSVDVLKFDASKIWVSIYLDDDEAFNIWNKEIGVPEERIVRLGKEDNFWGPAGDEGACGPCSELYIDKGEENGCGQPDCKPGCDCDRYMEYWNLVFNQFHQDKEGKQTPLPRTGIDTGMGLERLATICQNVSSIYETDELKQLVDFVCKELDVAYEGDNKVAVNVIVEHARSLTFAMTDGAYPSNEGRGYVLRRILRRALRFARTLGVTEPFVYKLVDKVVEIMGSYYPEIVSAAENIKNVLIGEEKRFLETLENGMTRLEDLIAKSLESKSGSFSGKEAFVLYDTYGFPVEMTAEMVLEKGLKLDFDEFESEMEKQRERGKQSWKAGDDTFANLMQELSANHGETQFVGYCEYESKTSVNGICNDNGIVDSLKEGEQGYLVLHTTPFYGESGGQLGDQGTIYNESVRVHVTDTKKINKTVVHHVVVEKGEIKNGSQVVAQIDALQRNLTKANHTVTHLLQAALRDVLGDHVKQAGSLVGPERMRFDFSHFKALTEEELKQVEELVNRVVWENLEVSTSLMGLDEALKSGAMAEFGEKYESTVRVVKAGDFSTELCGGTHVDNTGEIGIFKIVKESSPGAGTRRIEGITLKGVFDRLSHLEAMSGTISSKLNVAENVLLDKLDSLIAENSKLKKEVEKGKSAQASSKVDDIIKAKETVNGIAVIVYGDNDLPAKSLRELSDMIRSKEQKSVLVLASGEGGKVMLVAAATKAAVEAGADAGAVIKEIAPTVGGRGGGKKEMAQAGGSDVAKIAEALEQAKAIISKQLG